jgi:hypothetical protein
MDAISIHLEVQPQADADAEVLSQATIELRRRLLDLPIESADLVRDSEAPPGSKAADALSLGHLMIVTLPFGGAISAIAAIAIAKIKAGAAREVVLTIGDHELHLTGQSDLSQAKIIDKWLDEVSEETNK